MSVTIQPTTTVPATAPSSSVVPFPMGWGGGAPQLAGCCPPGGNMSSLMQCWCDVQAAQAFICAMMVECINTNPAVTAAIIAAIEKSGSSLPLLGVTNGVAAQPGQVGEYIQMEMQVPFSAATQTQPVTMGVLQPGDWDCWAFVGMNVIMNGLYFNLNPAPAGFSNALAQELDQPGIGNATVAIAPMCEALTSVPSLINFQLQTNTAGTGNAGTANMFFCARRMR